MKKIFFALITSLVLLTSLFVLPNNEVAASTKWGKVDFKENMIGKVKVLKDTYQYSISNKKLKKGKKINKGNEYGVYSYSKNHGGIYEIGKNRYVKKSSSIKYYKASLQMINDAKGYGTVKGDVTWQYNRYVGTKPDVGAKVFLIPYEFNPKNFKQKDLELYSIIGSVPENSNLFYVKANGYGRYELNDIPAGKYLLIVSSRETTRNPDEKVYIESDLKKRLGKAYNTFYQFNVGDFNNYTWEVIQLKKGKTIDFSYDFGYTYI